MKPRPRIVVGAGVLVHKSGKLLLVKRAEQPDKGRWSYPGGAVELGETTEDAAVREVKEETGLDVVVESLFGVATYFPGRGNAYRNQIIVVDYQARPLRGKVRLNRESSDFGWFSPHQVQSLDATDNVKLFAARFGRTNAH